MDWAGQKGYNILKIKTRNNRREMLNFLLKNGFYFINIEEKKDVKNNRINLQKNIPHTENLQIEETNDIKELVQTMKEIRDCLLQLVNIQEKQDEISFISRKDIKSIFNFTDTTVEKMFNRADFPVIMIGEHKVEKSALNKWFQERRT